MAFLTDENKRNLVDRYCDIEWCDVTHLRCVHCHRVPISHYVFSCQHLICKDCRDVYGDKDQQLSCPFCMDCSKQRLDKKDFDVEIDIHKLRIFCPNKKYGCNYADQLRKIPSHLMTCVDTREKALLAEPPVTSAIKDVVNQLKSRHATVGELAEKLKVVDNKVEEKLNQVERKMDDIDINALTSEDKKVEEKEPVTQIESTDDTEEFQSSSLKLEPLNERIEQNESFVKQMMEEMALNIEKMTTKINTLTVQNEELLNKRSDKLIPVKAETYEWTVKDVKKSKENRIYESEVFKVAGYKYEFKVKMDDYTSTIGIHFKDGDKINKFLNFDDGFSTVSYIIRDQSDNLEKKDILCKEYPMFGYGYDNWMIETLLPYEVFSPPYMKDDCMKITISLEPPSNDVNFFSNNGVLVWRVDKYEERKQNQLGYDNWSPCFYTSPRGYRVRIKLSITEKSMSVEVCFLTGKHDAMLTDDFDHMTTVTLLNQSDPSKSLVKTQQSRDLDLYTITFDTSKSMDRNSLVNDDSILIKVKIEPLARK